MDTLSSTETYSLLDKTDTQLVAVSTANTMAR